MLGSVWLRMQDEMHEPIRYEISCNGYRAILEVE